MKAANGIVAAWTKVVRSHPHKTVLIDLRDGATWTARAVDDQARALRPRMREAKTCIALALPNSPSWIFHFLAAQMEEKTVVPIDFRQPESGQLELAASWGASHLFREMGMTVLTPKLRRHPKGTAFLKLTSGTTGAPRAWPCLPAHLMADGKNVCASMGIRSTDRNLGLIPLGHSYAIGNLVMPLLLQGTGLALAPDFLPSQIPDWIARYHLTVFPTVPAVLRIFAQMPAIQKREKKGTKATKGLRLVISAGAPLPPETARAFHQTHGLTPRNFYGSSETGGIAYDRTGRGSLHGTHLGTPLRGVTIRITRGKRVEVSSLAVLTPSGRHLLADRGTLLPGNHLQLLGREAAPANIGGLKVQPAEIQLLLQQHPRVHEALVWVHHEKNRDVLAAAVESSLTSLELQTYLTEKVSAWKIPKVWHVAQTLPRTDRGKIDRSQLIARP